MSFTRPLNTILASGEPIIEELVCDTSTNCFPRRLVKKGTTGDTSFNVCGASDKHIGILDISHKRGIGDYYRAGEPANVLQGPCVVVGETDASGNITKEDRLIADAGGKVKKANDDASLNSTFLAGVAKESVTYTGGVLPILFRMVCVFMVLAMFGTGKKRGIG